MNPNPTNSSNASHLDPPVLTISPEVAPQQQKPFPNATATTSTATNEVTQSSLPRSVQELVQQQGVIAPFCATLIRQVQNDVSKFLDDKLKKDTLEQEKIKKRDTKTLELHQLQEQTLDSNTGNSAVEISALQKSFLEIRRQGFYIRYLQLVYDMAPFAVQPLVQLLLKWAPSLKLVPRTNSRQRSLSKLMMPSKKSASTGGLTPKFSAEEESSWAYSTFLKSIPNYFSTNQAHNELVNCTTLIIIGDILTIILTRLDPTIFDADIFFSLITYTMELFPMIYSKKENASGIWKFYEPYIFDQWCYVMRRLTTQSLQAVINSYKEKVHEKAIKEDCIALLKGLRFVDINVTIQNQLEPTKELLDFLIDCAKIHKKSNSMKNVIFEVLDVIYMQLDFELQEEAMLFVSQTGIIFEMAQKYAKVTATKANALRLISTITIRHTFDFFNTHIDSVLKKCIETVKKDPQCTIAGVESTFRLFEDKYNLNKNIDFVRTVGDHSTFLERNNSFSSIVYSEVDKNVVKFTDNRDQYSDKEDQFSIQQRKYLTTMQSYIPIVLNELFSSKKPAPVTTASNVHDDIISLYSNIILRIARFKLDTVLQVILPTMLHNKTKAPENYLIGLRALKFILGERNAAESCCILEVEHIKKNATYAKYLSEFTMSNVGIVNSIIKEVCEVHVGFQQIGKTQVALPLQRFDANEFLIEEHHVVQDEDAIDEEDETADQETMTNQTVEPAADESNADDDLFTGSVMYQTSGYSFRTKMKHMMTHKEISKKERKETKKQLDNVNKLKKEKFIYVKVYAEAIQCIPYILPVGLLKHSDPKEFIGALLVYNDRKVAISCSTSLQKIMYERADLREDIIQGCTVLVEKLTFSEPPVLITILKNINLLLQLWKKARKEQILSWQNDKNMKHEKILEMMKPDWNSPKLWIDRLEANAVACLAVDDREIRSTALEILESCAELIDSEQVPYLKGPLADYWKRRRTFHDLVMFHEEEIIQRAAYFVALDDAHGVRREVNIKHGVNETIKELANGNDILLWSKILMQLGAICVRENYSQMYKCLIDLLKERLTNFPPLPNDKSDPTTDDPVVIAWTDTLSLLLSLSGVQTPENSESVGMLHNIHEGLSSFLSAIPIWKYFLQTWARHPIVAITSSINWQSLHIMLEHMINTVKPMLPPRKKMSKLSLIVDLCRIVRLISDEPQFPRSFTAPNDLFKPKETLDLFWWLVSYLLEFLESVEMDKVKSIDALYVYKCCELDITITLGNIARAVYKPRSNILNTLMSPYGMTNECLWEESSRIRSIKFLQLMTSDQHCSNYLSLFNTVMQKSKIEGNTKSAASTAVDKLLARLRRCAFESAECILTVGPLPSNFSEDRIKSYDWQFMKWFEDAHLSGFKMLSPLLCHHFGKILPYYIWKCYSEKRDNVSEAYFDAIFQVLFPPSNPPKLPNSKIIQDIIGSIIFYQAKEDAGFFNEPIDDDFLEDFKTHRIKVLQLLLWGCFHASQKVHSQCHHLLYALSLCKFGCIEKQLSEEEQMSILQIERLLTSFQTGCENSLTSRAHMLSTHISLVFKEFTDDLFTEMLRVMKVYDITPQTRKLWLLRTITPWCRYINLSNQSDNFLPSLLEIFNRMRKIVGFTIEQRIFWQELAQAPGSNNLSGIISFVKRNITSLDDECLCREIVTSLYYISPDETIQLLVKELTAERYQRALSPSSDRLNTCNKEERQESISEEERSKDDHSETLQKPVEGSTQELVQTTKATGEDSSISLPELNKIRKAVEAFLVDIVSESDDINPLFQQLTIIIPYAFVHLESPEDQAGKISNCQYLLYNILLRLFNYSDVDISTLSTLTMIQRSERRYLFYLLRSKALKLNWGFSVPPLRQSIDKKLKTLRNGKYVVMGENLLPFLGDDISAKEFIHLYAEAIESTVASDLMEQIGYSCLIQADQAQDINIAVRFITIYYSILKPIHSYAILKLLNFISRGCRMVENGSSVHIPLLVLGLKTAKEICTKLDEQNLLHLHTNIFWAAVAMLSSSHFEVYECALNVIDVFRSNSTVFQQLFKTSIQAGASKEVMQFTDKWYPQYQGFQPLLIRGLYKKHTEVIVIQILLALADIRVGDIIEIPSERRVLTMLLFIMPWLHNQSVNPPIITKKNENEFVMAEAVCTSLAASLRTKYPYFAQVIENVQLLGDDPDAYLEALCKGVSQLFFPVYATYCADLLYQFLTHGNPEFHLGTLVIIRCFLHLSHGPLILNSFSSLFKVALTKVSSDQKLSPCAIDVLASAMQLACERGDSNLVQKDTLPFMPYNSKNTSNTNTTSGLEKILTVSRADVGNVEEKIPVANKPTPKTTPVRFFRNISSPETLPSEKETQHTDHFVEGKYVERRYNMFSPQRHQDEIIYAGIGKSTVQYRSKAGVPRSMISREHHHITPEISTSDYEEKKNASKMLTDTISIQKFANRWKEKTKEKSNSRENDAAPVETPKPEDIEPTPESSSSNLQKDTKEETKKPEEVEVVIDDSDNEVVVTPLRTRRRAPTIYDVLDHEDYLSFFEKFVHENFESDSLDFLIEVKDYSKLSGSTDRAVTARTIIDRFIKLNSPDCIKMENTTRNSIVKEYQSGNTMDPASNLFKKAVDEVTERMDKEIYPEFVKSKQYGEMMKNHR